MLLRELMPRLSRIGVVLGPTNQGNTSCMNEIQAASQRKGNPACNGWKSATAKSIERAFAAIAKDAPRRPGRSAGIPRDAGAAPRQSPMLANETAIAVGSAASRST